MYLLYFSEVVKPWQSMEEILHEELWAMDSRFFPLVNIYMAMEN